MNLWLIISTVTLALIIILIGAFSLWCMRCKNRNMMEQIEVKQLKSEDFSTPNEKPSVSPFDYYENEDMTKTMHGKFNMVKANVGEIVADKKKSQ